MAEDIIKLMASINRKNSGLWFWTSVANRWNWRTAGLIFGFYTLSAILFLPQTYLYSLEAGAADNPLYAFLRLALVSYLYAALTPLVFLVGNKLPVERPNILRNVFIHFILSLLFGVVFTIAYHYILGFFVAENFAQINRALFSNWAVFFTNVTNAFPFYVGILAFNQAINYSRKFRDREFRLQQAELEALKTQLHPHFLFNTLNAISALVYVSPPDATKTISQLSDLLRLTLHNDKAQEVPLKEEIDFLRKYVQIQQTLLQERLEVDWAIAPETLDALVPNMILQPLVENSIRHGIAPKEDGGKIEIFSRRVNGDLLIEIKDTGLGAESNDDKTVHNSGSGIGLKNTAARLERLYGVTQRFESAATSNGAGCGWCAAMTIPFREQQPSR